MQVHSCHGPARQIDVLREVLLGLLADDPTLEPRDILVMCPDIETYAPLIVAGFGLGDVDARARIPRTGCGCGSPTARSSRPTRCSASQSQLLALAGGRATASEVLNLAQAAPVRARFGFTDDDLEDITRWVRQANIRWGFDREHRKPYGVDFVQNTWRFGIDRVLAGVAMSDDSHAWIDTTLPLDDVSSNRVELAGQLAEYVDRLQRVVESLTGARPLRDWLTALDRRHRPAGPRRRRRRVADQPAAARVRRRARPTRARARDTAMRLPDIRALLDRHLAGRPTRANFRTGTLTVCTMVPMRSVPHRVVCLVGLDDGVFPRLGVVDGDDVLARDPMTGERDIRSEDRQLLLDAIGAATEKLVITYTGANEYSGQERPPAVPLAELLDTLDLHHRRTRCATASSSNIRCSRSIFATSSPASSACPTSAVHVRPDRAAGGARARPASAPNSRRSSPARCRRSAARRRRARRPRRVLPRPGEGFLPRARLHAAVGRRRRRGRHARRHQRARGVDGRRPDARTTCCAA